MRELSQEFREVGDYVQGKIGQNTIAASFVIKRLSDIKTFADEICRGFVSMQGVSEQIGFLMALPETWLIKEIHKVMVVRSASDNRLLRSELGETVIHAYQNLMSRGSSVQLLFLVENFLSFVSDDFALRQAKLLVAEGAQVRVLEDTDTLHSSGSMASFTLLNAGEPSGGFVVDASRDFLRYGFFTDKVKFKELQKFFSTAWSDKSTMPFIRL